MHLKALLLSIDAPLSQKAAQFASDVGIDLDVQTGGMLAKGHLIVQKIQSEYDIIISMGATFQLLKDLISIPVIQIKTQLVDILHAVLHARNSDKKIVILLYSSSSLEDLEQLKRLIQVDFSIVSYTGPEELHKKVSTFEFSPEDTLLLVQGSCMTEYESLKSYHPVSIGFSDTCIYDALVTARNIVHHVKYQQIELSKRQRAVSDMDSDGVIVIGQHGKISIFNSTASKMLQIPGKDAIGSDYKILLEHKQFKKIYDDGSIIKEKIETVGDQTLIVNREHIVADDKNLGFVITFQAVKKLQKFEAEIRKKLYGKGLYAKYTFEQILGNSPSFATAVKKAKTYGSAGGATILISGETGVGKELFAQSMHNISDRKNGPFVGINCAALPEELLESELFGYEAGAFTGAKSKGKTGLFELAHNGTLFLDEIEIISQKLQGKILRELQERTVRRIGGDRYINIDTRIIAATNQNLYPMVQKGKFRADLFFRLNVLNLHIPPLRERKHDIPLLLKNFVKKKKQIHKKSLMLGKHLDMSQVISYQWPGNVRELENFVERLVILWGSSEINGEDFNSFARENLYEERLRQESTLPALPDNTDTLIIKKGTLKQMEYQILLQMLTTLDGNKSLLSQTLGISRTTLWKKIKLIESDGQCTDG